MLTQIVEKLPPEEFFKQQPQIISGEIAVTPVTRVNSVDELVAPVTGRPGGSKEFYTLRAARVTVD